MSVSKKKDFDCIEMKRIGSLALHELLKDLSDEERLAYFERRAEELRQLRDKLRLEKGLGPIEEHVETQ